MNETHASHQFAAGTDTSDDQCPVVSVIIPTFNRSDTLPRAVESVRNQTFKNLEILIIDDGSADDTPNRIRSIKKSDQRIRYFRLEHNQGAQAARNVGIKNARGKWIAFLDSDDMWLPRSLERRLEEAGIQGVNVIHSECYIKKEDGELMLYGVPKIRGKSFKQLLSSQGPMFPTLLATKKSLEKIGCLDEAIIAYQEWDTAIRLSKYNTFGFTDEPTFVYDCRRSDTISKNMLRNALGYKQVFHKHFHSILLMTGPWVIARHYRNIASIYREAHQNHAFVLYAFISFALWPFCPNLIIKQIQKVFAAQFFKR